MKKRGSSKTAKIPLFTRLFTPHSHDALMHHLYLIMHHYSTPTTFVDPIRPNEVKLKNGKPRGLSLRKGLEEEEEQNLLNKAR